MTKKPRMTLREMMQQRWSVVGPRQVELDGFPYWEIQVAELPDFVVAGETRAEVLNEYPAALEAFLRSFVEAGEDPPLPHHGT
jgi:predicted RNase H-like HicB family nuclease